MAERERRERNDLAERMASELGAGGKVAAAAVETIYQSLRPPRTGPADLAFGQWKTLMTGACGHCPEKPSTAARRLAGCFGLPADALPAELLFAVHTYYAALVRLVVGRWLAVLHARTDTDHFTSSPRPITGQWPASPGTSPHVSLLSDDLFGWHTEAASHPLEPALGRAAELLERWQPEIDGHSDGRNDLLTELYQAVFPRAVRHAMGEYYTPDWLVEHVLDEVGYQGDPDARLLDPTCGSGRFLSAAVRRVRRRYAEDGRPLCDRDLCRSILANIAGADLHPLAVLSAKANYLIALGSLARHVDSAEIPVRLGDSILRHDGDGREPSFDFVVGNPPWIAWDHLTTEYRQATLPLWQRYGLFSLSGSDARHGGGKKDLSMLLLYRTADCDLKEGGRLAMVITQTLFQTKGAGDGFRRFRLGPDGPPLRVLKVNDLVDVRPFADAASWTSTIVLEKGSPTVYPVPYVKWTSHRDDRKLGESHTIGSCQARCNRAARLREYAAEPIDPTNRTSPWFLRPRGLDAPLARLTGPSDYRAHLGANSGGANGVYWVELLRRTADGVLIRNVAGHGKRQAVVSSHVVEPDLLYPLLRWSDVARWRAVPSMHLLLVQDLDVRKGIDEAVMAARYPRTLAYLDGFRKLLVRRAAYRQYQQRAAFYSMYNVGRYTAAPIKVVWRRMDRRINAAVVEAADDPLLGRRAVVPQETCVLVEVDSLDEAHYLCGLLNSAIVNFLVCSHSVRSGKGFGTPSMLDYLRLCRFDQASPDHAAVATASRQAHQLAAGGEDLSHVEHEIDRLAAGLWGLSDAECEAIV